MDRLWILAELAIELSALRIRIPTIMTPDFFHACLGIVFTGIWVLIGQILVGDA